MVLRWVSLSILILAAVLSFIDRQIISLLVEPIKADLGISDTQIGLLQGLAFALFYSVAAIPFGWAADRYSRKWIIACGVVFWSLMTAISGLARNFEQLFAARLGVGFGEATLGPSVHSMIGDMFNRETLPLAMSVYGIGVSLGAGSAFLVGGQVAAWVAAAPPINFPFVGELESWHAAFMIVGLPGVLLAGVIALFVKEPKRSFPLRENQVTGPTLVGFAAKNWVLVLTVIGGISLLTASGYAGLAWLAAFFDRAFGWGPGPAGLAIGGVLIGGGIPGGILIGALVSVWAKRGRRDAAIIVVALATGASALTAVFAYLSHTPMFSIIWLVPTVFLGTCYVGLGPAIVQSVIPGALRGRASAWQLLITNTFGMIVGPLSVALFTDYVWRDESRLNWSLAIVVSVLSLLGAAAMWLARKPYLEALNNVSAERVPNAS